MQKVKVFSRCVCQIVTLIMKMKRMERKKRPNFQHLLLQSVRMGTSFLKQTNLIIQHKTVDKDYWRAVAIAADSRITQVQNIRAFSYILLMFPLKSTPFIQQIRTKAITEKDEIVDYDEPTKSTKHKKVKEMFSIHHNLHPFSIFHPPSTLLPPLSHAPSLLRHFLTTLASPLLLRLHHFSHSYWVAVCNPTLLTTTTTTTAATQPQIQVQRGWRTRRTKKTRRRGSQKSS